MTALAPGEQPAAVGVGPVPLAAGRLWSPALRISRLVRRHVDAAAPDLPGWLAGRLG